MKKSTTLLLFALAFAAQACSQATAPADSDLNRLIPSAPETRSTSWIRRTVALSYTCEHPTQAIFAPIQGLYRLQYSFSLNGDSAVSGSFDCIIDTTRVPFDTVRSWMQSSYYSDYQEIAGTLIGRPATFFHAASHGPEVSAIYFTNLIGDSLSVLAVTWYPDKSFFSIARRALLSIQPVQ